MIRVAGLSRRFGERWAVRDVSFDVETGDVLGFLGPNGAGKTTTMRILTGYLPATSGRVEIAGHDLLRNPLDVKRRVGYLPESPPLYPEMITASYLRFVATLKGVGRAELPRRVEVAMDRCGLADVGHRLIGNLSKGYRQRVGLAAALVHDPDVLILDEPTVGLDPVQIREIRALIRSLAARRTVVLSTHVLAEVTATCNRALIINEGRIVVSGSLDALQGGGGSVHLVLGVEADVSRHLEGVPGVASVEVGEAPGHYRVKVEDGQDPRESLAALAAREGWRLRELRGERASLEQVFVDAIAQPAGEGPA